MFIPIIDLRGDSSAKGVAKEMQKAEIERLQRKFVIEYLEKNFVEPEKDAPLPLILRIVLWACFFPIIIFARLTLGSPHTTKVNNAKRKMESEAKKVFKEEMRKEGYDVDNLL